MDALAGAAIGMTAAQSIGQAYAMHKQGQMQQAQYDFLAQQSKLQASLAIEAGQEQAKFAQDQGAKLSKDLRKNVGLVEANQRATMIANGIDLGSVTAEDIINDTVNKAKLDEMMIRYNADLAAYQAEQQAGYNAFAAYSQAAGQTLAGQMYSAAGNIGATNTLISGAAQTAYQWDRMRQYERKPSGNEVQTD